MKKFLVQFFFLIIVIGVALFFFRPGSGPKNFEIPFLPQRTTQTTLEINGHQFKVEVADTQSKRNKGLSGRQNLGQDQGMLFVFDRPDKYPFWMKGLNFPLDFIWINGDKVVDILPNISPPSEGQPDESLTIYQARVEIDKVLEINGGITEKLGIKIGDSVKFTP